MTDDKFADFLRKAAQDYNRPPEAPAIELAALVGQPRSIALPAIDPDGDDLSYEITQQPRHGELGGTPPQLTYTASGGETDGISYTVTDGEFEVEGVVVIDIRLSNEPPVAGLDQYDLAEGQLLSVAAPGVLENDRDADGEALRAVLIAPPDHGDLTLDEDGSFEFRPDVGYVGPDKFTYAAVDGLDEEGTATVVLRIGEFDAEAIESPPVEATSENEGATPAITLLWTPPEAADRSFVASRYRIVQSRRQVDF